MGALGFVFVGIVFLVFIYMGVEEEHMEFFFGFELEVRHPILPSLFLSLCKQGILIQMKDQPVLAHGTCQ